MDKQAASTLGFLLFVSVSLCVDLILFYSFKYRSGVLTIFFYSPNGKIFQGMSLLVIGNPSSLLSPECVTVANPQLLV